MSTATAHSGRSRHCCRWIAWTHVAKAGLRSGSNPARVLPAGWQLFNPLRWTPALDWVAACAESRRATWSSSCSSRRPRTAAAPGGRSGNWLAVIRSVNLRRQSSPAQCPACPEATHD